MISIRSSSAVIVLGLVVLAGSCSRKPTAPPPPPEARLGPEVETVFPAARSVRVLTTTEIWVRFRNDVDPATLNVRTVFLKLDTQRIPILLSYESPTRTLRLVPQAALGLYRTHTIELMPTIETADGVPLGDTQFWQFTTSSVRPPANPLPASGTEMESPLAMLLWLPTESTAGLIEYQVYASTDSDSVLTRSTAPTIIQARNFLLPVQARPFGTTFYWAVDVRNLDTGEDYSGPLWRYSTLPADTPIESMSIRASLWGNYDRRFGGRRTCNSNLSVSDDFNCAVRWATEGVPSETKVANVFLDMPSPSNLTGRRPTIWGTLERFSDCASMGLPGPPYVDGATGRLAQAQVPPEVPGRVRFTGPLLSAYVEGMVRRGGLHGFVFKASAPMSYGTPGDLTISYYRVPTPVPHP